MYEFLDRLTSSALPRIRDFSGIKADGFDGRGNYNLGITLILIIHPNKKKYPRVSDFKEENLELFNKLNTLTFQAEVRVYLT